METAAEAADSRGEEGALDGALGTVIRGRRDLTCAPLDL
jgi:hypothetical protein